MHLMWVATAERSREIDRAATEKFGIEAAQLMERAGEAVFQSVRKMLPKGRVAVFCGKGNNGGDGLVVARLAHQAGYCVRCFVAAERGALSPLSALQLESALQAGVQPVFADSELWKEAADCVGCRDLIVDALLGTGATGEATGAIAESIRIINRSGVPVVAVDVPSGIRCDTGKELGAAVLAVRTITFGLPKRCFFVGAGVDHAGHWTVADIGFPKELLDEATEARLLDCRFVGRILPERMRSSHKGDSGRTLIVAGSERMPGAAVISARAALRAGAGTVTVASVASVCQAVAAQVPEAMIMPLPEREGGIAEEAAPILLDTAGRYDASLFGPGLSTNMPTIEFLDRIWRRWEIQSCIDADALTAVAQGVNLPACPGALTPHPGEMARLLHVAVSEVQADRFAAANRAAHMFRKAILLKGPYSLVADLSQPLLINRTGNPGMATGGMGDALSGVILALMGQGLPPTCAAACGMYWHGLAGDLCAKEIGPIGYTASDLSERLPRARVQILRNCDEACER
jgi:ADP-dependent NAD(P)H-hydrate dehydratase / NAD(P)H-hydrate epimerase